MKESGMLDLRDIPDVFVFDHPTDEDKERGFVARLKCAMCGEPLLGIPVGSGLSKHLGQAMLHWTGSHGGQ
jgi:hypothetical protein